MAKARILLVEDEAIVARSIKNRLNGLGYDVCAIVSSGEEAVKKAAQLRPDLVLMDIVLDGDMDGVQAAEKIRTRLDVPVIYLTAHADKGTLQRAKLTGPFGYILKPFEARELLSTVEVALYKHAMERRLKESEERLELAHKGLTLVYGIGTLKPARRFLMRDGPISSVTPLRSSHRSVSRHGLKWRTPTI